MDRLKVEDLAPSMRLDESLHLPSGELALYRRQALDELFLDALDAAGVTELALAAGPAEVEALALGADRQAVPVAEISERTVFTWGLYDATGRKVLSAGRRLTTHRAWLLRSAGVDVLLEPASDLAATVARRRRFLLRRRAPRPGRAPVLVAAGAMRVAAEGGASGPSPRAEPDADARSTLALAMLASEAETLIRELSAGLSLDVPGALDAARSVVADTFARPFASVACAVEMLASGRLRERAAASAVIAVAAARAAAWREDESMELAAGALLHEAPYSWLDEDASDRTGETPLAVRIARERLPVRAHMLLADADGLAPGVALTVLQVHERLDGSGRPFGLTAGEILPGAKLLAATDAFCRAARSVGTTTALNKDRQDVCRSESCISCTSLLKDVVSSSDAATKEGGLSGHEAMKRCIELAGDGILDGEAVRALLRAVGLYPAGTYVRLSTGEIARVVATSEAYERPVVSVTRTSAGLPPAERRVMDLSRLTGIGIDRPVPGDQERPGPTGAAPREGEGGL